MYKKFEKIWQEDHNIFIKLFLLRYVTNFSNSISTYRLNWRKCSKAITSIFFLVKSIFIIVCNLFSIFIDTNFSNIVFERNPLCVLEIYSTGFGKYFK